MSCYICYKINTDIPEESQNNAKSLETPVLSFANEEDSIRLKWDAIEGAQNYRITRKLKQGSWEVIDYAEGDFYDDLNVEAGVVYYYRIYACNGDALSKVSEAVKVQRLTKPVLDSASAAADGVTLSWQPVTGAGYYYVYRSADGQNYEKISNRVKELTFRDESVSSGSYYYRLQAANSNNTFTSVLSEAVAVEF